MSECTFCNKELALNAKFCKFCGASQAVKLPSTSNESFVINKKSTPACKKCNNELIPSAKFCKVCGTKVSNEPITELPITELPSLQHESLSSPTSSQKPLKSNTIKYVIICSLVTVLIGGIGYWGLMNKRVSDEAATLAENQRTEIETQKKLEDEEAKRIAEEEKTQKKLEDEEAKRIAEEEKTKTIANAGGQKRIELLEKQLLLLQKEDQNKRASETKRVRENVASSNQNTPTAVVDNENKTNRSETFDFRVPLFTDKAICNSYSGYKVDISISKDGILTLTKNASNETTSSQGKVDFSTIKEQKTSDKYYSVDGTVGNSNLKIYANNKGIFRIEVLQKGNISEVMTCG
jgi:hypothetical protein